MQQSNASAGLWTKPVGRDKHPNPKIQVRIGPKNDPLTFMTHWLLSDPFKTHHHDELLPTSGKGTFLPCPTMIWGAEATCKMTMLETLTTMWKVLQGDLSAQDAYLSVQAWRDI